ncbi:HAD-IA family hydrolase [Rossellomorea oryzaecorticis]|uniref:HAD-IA family hydrolase n=1 Tax=Rossellomorea oryzaecorticis TaxID=1396505 RepID=A0ABU9K3Z2_9BACI
MDILNGYDIIIFDCDGVLLDSNKQKSDAFKITLKDYDNNYIEDFLDYHKNNGGISRYEKFKYFLSNILENKFEETTYKVMLKNFSKNCIELYTKVDMTEGSLKLLSSLSEKKCFIASGSDQEELIEVFKKRDLDKYFNGIFGSPTPKNEIIGNILENNIGKALMIGDSIQDYKAAFINNIDFLFVKKYSEQNEMLIKECEEKSIASVNTLLELVG